MLALTFIFIDGLGLWASWCQWEVSFFSYKWDEVKKKLISKRVPRSGIIKIKNFDFFTIVFKIRNFNKVLCSMVFKKTYELPIIIIKKFIVKNNQFGCVGFSFSASIISLNKYLSTVLKIMIASLHLTTAFIKRWLKFYYSCNKWI